MDEKLDKKDSKKLSAVYLLVVLCFGILAVGAVIFFVEPEELPEDSIFNSTPEVQQEVQQDQGKSGLADLTWEPEPDSEVLVPLPDEVKIPEFVPNLTNSQKDIDMPQSVVEMAMFLSGKEISTDDLAILMDYAVHQERNNFDEIVDTKARIVMEKLLQ